MKNIDKIVENFLDTGKVVLNEHNAPEMTTLRRDYDSIAKRIEDGSIYYQTEVDGLYDQWDNLTPYQKEEFERINYNSDDEDFEDKLSDLTNGVADTEEETDTEEVEQYLDGLFDSAELLVKNNPTLAKEKYQNFLDEINKHPTLKGEYEDKINKSKKYIDERDRFETNLSIGPTLTQHRRKEKRQDIINTTNQEELPYLTINYEGDKEDELYRSNLRILQFILLYNKDLDLVGGDKKKLQNEIDNFDFGEVTEFAVKLFQAVKGLDETGIVDTNTWNALMVTMRERENQKLTDLDEGSAEIDNDLIDKLTEYSEINKEGFGSSKKKLFTSLSLKLFSNLVDKEIYPDIKKKGWETYSSIFKSGIQRPERLEELKKQKKNVQVKINNFAELNKGKIFMVSNPYKEYQQTQSDLTKEINRLEHGIEGGTMGREYSVDNEPIGFWKEIVSRWGNAKPNEQQKIKKEYVDYRNNHSIELLHEKIIKKLKESLEEGKVSINEVNELIQSINHAIYNVFFSERTDQTKKQKIRTEIRNILSKTNLDNIYGLIDGLKNINIKKLKHNVYEESFCGCENVAGVKYFDECNTKKGDKSKIFTKPIVKIKELIKSDKDVIKCGEILYKLIIDEKTTSIDKYDVITNTIVTLTNNVEIPKGKKIEVKDENISDNGFTLSEFIGLYKKREDIEEYKNINPTYYEKYNDIIENVVNRLNENDGGLKDMFAGENKMYGIFTKDYYFYHHTQIELEWSTNSNQKRFADEKRITVRFKPKENETPSRWVEGNCNLGVNGIDESIENTDYISEYVNNILDF
jgi:hypothetical protein